jgi:hypothetical protein
MTKIIQATVALQPGGGFTAPIVNLTPSSLFLATNQELHFRELVTVSFYGITLQGEVALVTDRPLGALVVFNPPRDARRVIESIMGDVAVIETDRVAKRKPSFEMQTIMTHPALDQDEENLPATAPLGVPPIVMDPDPDDEIPHSSDGATADAFHLEPETLAPNTKRNDAPTVPDPGRKPSPDGTRPPFELPRVATLEKDPSSGSIKNRLGGSSAALRKKREEQLTEIDPETKNRD